MLRIKEIQQKKNIKNVELSALTGIGVQQISYYHTGHRTPPLSTLEKIAQALNCEMAELLLLGEDFMHLYDDKTGEWLGIIPKPTTTYHATPKELASIDRGLQDLKAGHFISVEEAEAEIEALWEE